MRHHKKTNGWTETAPEALEIAMACARGNFQRGIISGEHAMNGSTVVPLFRANYMTGLDHLLGRLRAAGLVVGERQAPDGRTVLTITVGVIARPTPKAPMSELERLRIENAVLMTRLNGSFAEAMAKAREQTALA
jgi:hypothetical protein